MKTKTFDCIEMKRRAQERIRAEVAETSREEEVAYFRKGAAEFEARIAAARREARTSDHTSG